ncbi:cysteine proteinase inhibitor 12 [Pistacia vera]|uniref:cysteine proteinase inhibitor 12 n=1 Tax=Pistacia vera TaxID=55513 RepID=UPI001263CF26|nr:cysteine proteinase inhibitor 12 [Pistacia vera]
MKPTLSLILFIAFSFKEFEIMAMPGALQESRGAENSVEIDELGRFAVQEHNKKQNAVLEFGRVVKAQEQVVAGTLHHLTIEAIEAGKKKLYEAKVWVKPWMNFKDLQEFKHVGDSPPTFTSSDLGCKKEGHGPGWQEVPAHDPVVQDAANHAVQTIQQRSNSLFPFVLQEIVHAKAEVVEDFAKFNMLLKVKRGDKEEKFKVEVHKKTAGTFHLNQMEQDHS